MQHMNTSAPCDMCGYASKGTVRCGSQPQPCMGHASTATERNYGCQPLLHPSAQAFGQPWCPVTTSGTPCTQVPRPQPAPLIPCHHIAASRAHGQARGACISRQHCSALPPAILAHTPHTQVVVY
mmetsp:Transcript_3549/g.7718  ORF Transcript_3549/g.7718 Transcript_3549/m.7718 type:complete len:125 (-) Transcript_3549:1262-1636(-)